ncbi:MAG: helix-turn-helix transcriptional regulator [Clostridia bacterium]|nr:helix-turn-helix transcriptional regulator [Clostridia bacterium]MBR5365520.1 helix-turn-helix transcriptional regulator [Clostridia bacterium]
MTFGEVVRTERTKKGLTQEKLSELLGVSSQAVSKWETTGCYPDAELLVPLANALDVSLDSLFRNGQVTERDASLMVFSLMQKEEERDGGKPFELIRRLCWGTIGATFGIFEPTPAVDGMSSVVSDDGFTEASCEPYAPFFSVFPEPENGWGEAVGDGEELRSVFTALGDKSVMKALLFLLTKESQYLFEPALLTKELGIDAGELDAVMSGLRTLGMVSGTPVVINGETRKLYYYHRNEKVIPLLLFAKFVRYNEIFHLQSDNRRKPLIRP